MAVTHGNDGVVKIGANEVANIQSFSITETIASAMASSMGDTWESRVTGLKDWQAEITVWWDAGDTNGQEALTVGAAVTVDFYPQGDAPSDVYYSGVGVVTEVGNEASKADIVTRSITVLGNGALTRSTVA